MNPLLFYAGAALQFFGAWNIDWAHLAWERGESNVGLPMPHGMYYVDRAFWWNLGFFGGIVGGSILIIIGALW